MKPRVAFLLLLIALAGGFAARQRYSAMHGIRGTGASEPGKPAKTDREGDALHEERFAKLTPEMRKIVLRLEEAAITRERGMSDYQKAIESFEDWDRFAIAEIEKLETGQIQALAEWLYDENGASELPSYAQSIFLVWGSRDPAAARAMLLTVAKAVGLLDDKTHRVGSNFADDLSDHFHHIRVGHARLDPAAAWREFLTDSADPAMNRLVNASVTLPQFFEIYTEKSPADAWHQVLTHPKEAAPMLEGFAKGAPTGQDWQKLGRDYLEALRTSGEEVSAMSLRPLTERWLTEDPQAALDWFTANASENEAHEGYRLIIESNPPVLPGEEEFSRGLLRELELVNGLHDFGETHVFVRTLELLVSQGREDLAALAIQVSVGNFLRGYNLPFLNIIPTITEPALRNALYLQAVSGIVPRRADDPFASPSITDSPDVCIEAIRALAAKLDLPPEIREQADAKLREVAEIDRKFQEDWARRAKDDPFAQ